MPGGRVLFAHGKVSSRTDRLSRVRVATRGTPMRLTTDRRLAVALLAALALAGCDGKKPVAGPTAGSSTTSELQVIVAKGRTPRQAVEEFLRDLSAGKVTPAQLTPAFRAQVAPPVA